MGAAPRFNLSSSSLSFSICASLIAIFFSVELVLPTAKSTSHSIHVYCRRVSTQGYSLAILRTTPPFLCVSLRISAVLCDSLPLRLSAAPRLAKRLLCSANLLASMLISAFAKHLLAKLTFTIAFLLAAVLHHCIPNPSEASPLLCASLRFSVVLCSPLPLLGCAVRSCSLAVPTDAYPRYTVATHYYSLPFLRGARLSTAYLYRCVTRSPPSGNDPFQSFATGRCRRTARSPATPARLSRGRRTEE